MSYVQIYGIDAAGQVFEWERIHNPHGWCVPYWQRLAHDFGLTFELHNQKSNEAVWEIYRDERLGISERLMLGATFDRAWVPTKWLHDLVTNLASHHLRFAHPDFTPTMLSMAASLARLRFERASNDRHNLMGVCFNGTSVSPSPWYAPPAPGEEDFGPLINITSQSLCSDGKPHWMVEPQPRRLVFPVSS